MSKNYKKNKRRIELDIVKVNGQVTYFTPKSPVKPRDYTDNHQKKARLSADFIALKKQIESKGLIPCTTAETLNLIFDLYIKRWPKPEYRYSEYRIFHEPPSEDEEEEDSKSYEHKEHLIAKNLVIDDISFLEDKTFFGYNGNFFVPNKGVYIEDRPKIKRGKMVMDESTLIKSLEKYEKDIRIVPLGFETGELPLRRVIKNPYIIGLLGKKGTEKLANLADDRNGRITVMPFNTSNRYLPEISFIYFGYNRDTFIGTSTLKNLTEHSLGSVYYEYRAFGIKKSD